MADRVDTLLKFFDEHSTQARRHEDQRDRMTNLILVISGALVALIGQSNFATYTLPTALLMILLGLYGWVFAKKHYERNQLHVQTVREIREEIDRELGVLPWPNRDETRARKRSLGEIRDDADTRHYRTFPQEVKTSQRTAHTIIARSRLHHYWEGLPIVVIVVGALLALMIWFKNPPLSPQEVQKASSTENPTGR